jgi:hypothetical protein
VGDGTAAVGVEDEGGLAQRRGGGGVVDDGDAVEIRHAQAGQQFARSTGAGGDDDRPAGEEAATLQHDAVRGDRDAPHPQPYRPRRQGVGEPLGYGAGPAGRQARTATGEVPQGEVGAAAGRTEFGVAQQGGEQRAQEAVDRTRGEGVGERGGGGGLGAGEELLGGHGGEPVEAGAQPGPVHGARGAAGAGTDHGARREGPQLQAVEPGRPAQFGVRGVEELRAAVEAEAVHLVGGHPPADPVGGFEYRDAHSGAGQMLGRGQTGEAGTDHAYVRHVLVRWACR